MNSPTNLCDIAVEILAEIFRLLPLEDRKRVRSTCTLFHKACNLIWITKEEKLVIDGSCNAETVEKVLTACKYECLNLDFRQYGNKRTNVWKYCSQRVNGLFLESSYYPVDELKNIIIHCTNLNHLSISNIKNDIRFGDFVYHTNKALQQLLDEEVTRDKLVSLDMSFHPKTDGYGVLIDKMLAVFPKLQSLSIRNLKYLTEGASYGKRQIIWNPLAITTDFEEKLNVTTIKELVFELQTQRVWIRSLSESPLLRLKKFQTVFEEFTPLTKIWTVKFFANQKQIQIVNLIFHAVKFDELKEITLHIFHECLDLREFRLSYSMRQLIIFSDDEFRVLLNLSKLRIFDFRFRLKTDNIIKYDSRFSFWLSHGLSTLEFPRQCTEVDRITVLRLFRNLVSLDIPEATDEVLQATFQYQTQLRDLKLVNIKSCTDYGFTGHKPVDERRGYSIERLQKLEKLSIRSERWNLSGDVLMEFRFPKLKFLSITLEYNANTISTDNLQFLAENTPHLKELQLKNIFPYHLSKICSMELVAILQRLGYIELAYSCDINQPFYFNAKRNVLHCG